LQSSSHLASSFLLQAVHFFVSVAITFLLTPFVINTLGDYYFGLWVLLTTITGYFTLSELGIGSAVQNHLSICLGKGDRTGYKTVFSNAYFLYLLTCILTLLLVTASSCVILIISTKFMEPRLVLAILVISGTNVAVSFLFYPYVAVLASHVRFDIIGLISMFQVTVNALFTVAVLSMGFGLVGMALSSLLVSVSSQWVIKSYARKQDSELTFIKRDINKRELKSLLTYSSKTYLAQLSDVLRFKVDEIVTGAFVSVNLVTHYNVANRLVTVSNDFSKRFLTVLHPVFAQHAGREEEEKLRFLFFFSMKIMAVLSALLYVCLAILGKPFITLWLGVAFHDAYVPVLLLGGAFFVARMQAPAVTLFYATNTHQYFVYLSVCEGLANLGLSLLFVIRYEMGITGVALGTLIPILVSKLLFQPFLAARILKASLKGFYLLLLKVLFTGALIYGLFHGATMNFSVTTYPRIVLYLVVLSVLSVIHLGLVLSRRERDLIVEYLRKRISGVRS
jgi:O-antigen/teichoic acid export membrane protein